MVRDELIGIQHGPEHVLQPVDRVLVLAFLEDPVQRIHFLGGWHTGQRDHEQRADLAGDLLVAILA